MTGSIHQFNRQHSSTGISSNKEKTYRVKFRRCSSADNHSPVNLMVDTDSGTEELEQQAENIRLPSSNDNEEQFSDQSFSPIPDEGFSENQSEEEDRNFLIEIDLQRAKNIIDEMKKDFCSDTRVAFHGEFARLISVPLALYRNVRYYLLAEEEVVPAYFASIPFDFVKLDNVKAQFKCPNVRCQHAWTSMRARIIFSISNPTIGIIALKIFGQNCQHCGTNADALWYIDEVCRVMHNLAQALFHTYFPDMLNTLDVPSGKSFEPRIRHVNHDPNQRKGKMYAPHNKQFCQACRLGLCFP